jgi:hypothetical protein
MPVKIQVSQLIKKPVDQVFHFYAINHVKNHPRWDPDITLSRDSDEPIQVGTIFQRINNRSGSPVKGTMEVVEFESNQSFGVVIHDGPVEIRGRTIFKEMNENQSKLIIQIEFPDMDEFKGKDIFIKRVEGSIQNIKKMLELGKLETGD